MRRGAALGFAVALTLTGAARGDVLAPVEARVHQLDSLDRLMSGTFRQTVRSRATFQNDSIIGFQRLAVTVRHGQQEERRLVEGDTIVRTPPHVTSVLALAPLVLPYLSTLTGARAEDLHQERMRDTTLDGTPCAVIAFSYHRIADSTRARGAGRIWARLADWTPLRCAYDLQGQHPRRGDFLSSVTVDLQPVGPGLVVRATRTSVRFALQDQDLGSSHIEVLNDQFDLH